jgi:hypothetical protein
MVHTGKIDVLKTLTTCRSIQKHDWEPLLNFLEQKEVAVANLEQARQGPGYAQALPLQGMNKADEEEEEDDDFGQVKDLFDCLCVLRQGDRDALTPSRESCNQHPSLPSCRCSGMGNLRASIFR